MESNFKEVLQICFQILKTFSLFKYSIRAQLLVLENPNYDNAYPETAIKQDSSSLSFDEVVVLKLFGFAFLQRKLSLLTEYLNFLLAGICSFHFCKPGRA